MTDGSEEVGGNTVSFPGLFQHFNKSLLDRSTALPMDALGKQNTVQLVGFAANLFHWPPVALQQVPDVFVPSQYCHFNFFLNDTLNVT